VGWSAHNVATRRARQRRGHHSVHFYVSRVPSINSSILQTEEKCRSIHYQKPTISMLNEGFRFPSLRTMPTHSQSKAKSSNENIQTPNSLATLHESQMCVPCHAMPILACEVRFSEISTEPLRLFIHPCMFISMTVQCSLSVMLHFVSIRVHLQSIYASAPSL
jgi:hypothetical protein